MSDLKTPKIRFKGFTDSWEQCKLADVVEIVGGGTPSTLKPRFWNGTINWYTPAEIGTSIYLKNSQHRITQLGLRNSSAKILPKGTVLFTSRAGIGKTGILLENSCTNQGFQSLIPKSPSVDSYYIYTISYKLKAFANKVASGSTFLEISGKQLGKCPIGLPKEVLESKKISRFFKYIDSLITLHQRKCEKLQNLKKSLLEKMFTKNNSSKPEIRFKGFTDSWEQRELQDFSYKVAEKNTDRKIFETFTNSAEFGIISQLDYFDHEVSNKNNLSNYYVVKENDFIYNPRISTTAPVGPINRNKLGRVGVMSPLYTVFRVDDIQCGFLEYFFKSNSWHPYMLLNGDSGARSDRFSIKDHVFFKMPIKTPKSQEEQYRIALFLEKLDRVITLHQRQLEKLEKIKKSCLERMFV